MLDEICHRCCRNFPGKEHRFKLQTPSANTPTHARLGERFNYPLERQEMVKSSFKVCGISSSEPQKIRNGMFYKECMEKAFGDWNDEDLDESEEDPFFM